jgi:hypothetical protein
VTDLTFNNDPRRKQELRLRPACDAIYKQHLHITRVKRFDNLQEDERHLLDRYHGIDVVLRLPNGAVVTGQEKFLSHKFSKYETLTAEYYQNQHTKEYGDWFKLASQFYFTGYESVEGGNFCKWVIVNWLSLITDRTLASKWNHNANKNGRARASFIYIRFKDIPSRYIVAGNF